MAKRRTLNAIIDLSHHQADVDLDAAREDGIIGIIHKATQGTRFVDPRYAERRQQALDAGLLWGAYHFGDGQDALAQASHFLAVVEPTASDLLVLDYENNPTGPSMSLDGARAFVSIVHANTGIWPGLYSGHHLLFDELGDAIDPILGKCWLWLARYGPATPAQSVPPTWSRWTLWQYTDGAKGPEPREVEGIGPCDRNVFDGDFLALARMWRGTS